MSTKRLFMPRLLNRKCCKATPQRCLAFLPVVTRCWHSLMQRVVVPGSVAALLAIGVATSGYADIAEEEPNNMLAMVQEIPLDSQTSVSVSATIAGLPAGPDHDPVDYFKFTDLDDFEGYKYVGVVRSTTDLVLAPFQPNGNYRTIDEGPVGERFSGDVPADGFVTFGVTGWANLPRNNFLHHIPAHQVHGDYTFEFSVVEFTAPTQELELVELIDDFPLTDGIALGDNGNLFTLQAGADGAPWTLVEFTATGDEVGLHRGSVVAEGKIDAPRGVTSLSNGNLLLASPVNRKVFEVTTAGKSVDGGIEFATKPSVQGITYDAQTDTIWGVENFSWAIQEYSRTGEELRRIDFSKIPIHSMDLTMGLTVDPHTGNFWLVGEGSHNNALDGAIPGLIQMTQDGKVVSWIDLEEHFLDIGPDRPEGITIDPITRQLYIAFDRTEHMGIFQLPETTPGDFNSDGILGVNDLDKMAIDVTAGHLYGQYDMNSDGVVNIDDRRIWVHDVANTFLGDSDLNGEFNSGDFVTVFRAGRFESDEYASWSEGDWNGDKRFDTSDFVVAFQDGGFEMGPRASVNSVPEPSSSILLIIAALILPQFRNARQR